MTDFMPVFSNPQDERVDRARRAAKRAREMRVHWQSYARMILRNPQLRVEFTAGTPHTDGKTIWLRIPIELGDGTPHDRPVCGKRDENLVQRCPACLILEDCQITMYHEVSHIAFDSFMEMNDRDRTRALLEALRLEAEGKDDTTRAKKLVKLFERRSPSSFLEAGNMISPWLGQLINVGEDGRVNKAMMDSRKGSRIMFEAQVHNVFEKGTSQLDGSTIYWRDAPLNMQAIIGIYCKITEFDYTPYLALEVVQALDDATLNEHCRLLKTSRTARSVFHHAVPVLERLRELGFCKSADDVEDDPKPEPQPKQEKSDSGLKAGPSQPQPGSGESGESDESDDDTDEDADDDAEAGDEADGDDEGDGGSGDGEEDAESGGSDDPTEDDSSAENGDKDSDSTDSPGGSGSGQGDDPTDPEKQGDTGENTDSSDDSTDQGTDTDDDESDSDEDDDESGSASGSGDDEEGEPDDEDDFDGDEADDEGDISNPDVSHTEDEPSPPANYGTPDEVEDGFEKFARHDKGKLSPDASYEEERAAEADQEEVERALVQEENFDSPSRQVHGVTVRKNGSEGLAWDNPWHDAHPIPEISETILSPALMRLRLLFTENKRTDHVRDLRSGKVNGKVLGRRVPTGDDRLFQKKRKPGKRDYFVIIGLDVSGSTQRSNLIDLIKAAAYAKAELLARLGIRFAVYAHTGDLTSHYADNDYGRAFNLEIYEVKGPDEAWSNVTRDRLARLRPSSANLDGHTLEYYRKVAQSQKATDKIILYYTDGAMPLENYQEELEILQREIKLCARQNTSIVGVGIRNNDPEQHGLDTIRLDRIEDVPKVVQELEKRLSK